MDTFNYTERSSIQDLEKILDHLEVKNYMICRKGELKHYLKNPKITNYIINLDDVGNGSHWVFYSPKYNIYFDSYAQDKPLEIPKNAKLASTKKELQSIDSSICGQLCCLFAYYLNYKSKEEYYSLFKDVY